MNMQVLTSKFDNCLKPAPRAELWSYYGVFVKEPTHLAHLHILATPTIQRDARDHVTAPYLILT